MSQENVEIVRRAFAQMERGNFDIQELLDANVRIGWLDSLAVGGDVSVGIDDATEAIGAWLSSFERVTLTAERIVGAGEKVVVVAVWRGRGKASGVDTELRHGEVWTIRRGKLLSLVSSTDPREALEAAGLRE
jgi:ketosteroid isomerase-like protein